MKKLLIFLSATLFLCTELCAQEKLNSFESQQLGFSMLVPVPGRSNARTEQIAIFFMTPEKDFAPNVNILKEKYAGSIADYEKMSVEQFKQMNVEILKHSIDKNEITYEYKESFKGRVMHFYAKAVKSDDYIFMITGTGLEDKWEFQKAELTKAVDSFKLTK